MLRETPPNDPDLQFHLNFKNSETPLSIGDQDRIDKIHNEYHIPKEFLSLNNNKEVMVEIRSPRIGEVGTKIVFAEYYKRCLRAQYEDENAERLARIKDRKNIN